ncbi:MAG: type II toxin-antitoxin system VapC family toxin [Oscillospiraceae bacterium]|nr:type II toxin-antitoxin system VapC family toxin [Oscillospiraceae bacterium]
MKLLLDTHAALWWVNEYEKLSPEAKSKLLDEDYELYISIASIWEIAIKASLGKLTGLSGGVSSLLQKIEDMPVYLLPVEPLYIETVEKLPFIHRDPFDRMLIATAKADDMAILTADENIHKYDILTIW